MFKWLLKLFDFDPQEGSYNWHDKRIEASRCTDEFLAHIYTKNVPGWIAIGNTGVLIEYMQDEWLVTFEGTLPPTDIMDRHFSDTCGLECHHRFWVHKVYCRSCAGVQSCFRGLCEVYGMSELT